MAQFRHSIIQPITAITAAGSVTYELPGGPLSALLINLTPLNTGAVTAYTLEELLTAITSLEVAWQGATVVSASGADLGALAVLYHGMRLVQTNAVKTIVERRCLVLPILFGRRPYMQNECFPATNRGELTLTINWAITGSGWDTLRFSIEAIELPGARPSAFQKVTTVSKAIPLSSTTDIVLPVSGQTLRAVLLHGATGFTGASPTPTLGKLSLLKDYQQIAFNSTNFEVLRSLYGVLGRDTAQSYTHVHNYDPTGAGTSFDTGAPQPGGTSRPIENYVLMPLDVTDDDQYSLNTSGASSVVVRVETQIAGVSSARALPIERIAVNFAK